MLDFKEVRERYDAAEALKGQTGALQRTTAFFARPLNSDWHTFDSRGRLRGGGLLDTTLVKAVRKISDKIVQRLMPDGGAWAQIVIEEGRRQQMAPEERHQWDVALEMVSMVVQRGLERSNIRKVVSEAVRDFMALGLSGAMPIIRDDGQISFNYIPANKILLEDSPNMAAGGAFWRRRMTIRDWKRRYPDFPAPGGKDEQLFTAIFGWLPTKHGGYEFAFDEGGRDFLFSMPRFSARAGDCGGVRAGGRGRDIWDWTCRRNASGGANASRHALRPIEGAEVMGEPDVRCQQGNPGAEHPHSAGRANSGQCRHAGK